MGEQPTFDVVCAKLVNNVTQDNNTVVINDDSTRSGRPGPLEEVVTSAVLAWIRSSW